MKKNLAQLQQEFTDYVRNPDAYSPPPVNPRAWAIYADLVYNNIESFLTSFFPVMHSLLESRGQWHNIVRRFIATHNCSTPFFLEISQEFIQFLMTDFPQADYPPYIVELAHYEWVELALDTSTEELPDRKSAPDAIADEKIDVMDVALYLSPLAWCLSYQYPVHKISVQNAAPEPTLTYLVVYRDRQEQVQFLELNALSLRLLQLIQAGRTIRESCDAIALEINSSDREKLLQDAGTLGNQLLDSNILFLQASSE